MLLHCDGLYVLPWIVTGSKGDPEAKMARPVLHMVDAIGGFIEFVVGYETRCRHLKLTFRPQVGLGRGALGDAGGVGQREDEGPRRVLRHLAHQLLLVMVCMYRQARDELLRRFSTGS